MPNMFRLVVEWLISIVAGATIVLGLPQCKPDESLICIVVDNTLGFFLSVVIFALLIGGALVFERAAVHNSTPARIGIAVFLFLLSGGAALLFDQPANIMWRTTVIFVGFYMIYIFAAFCMRQFQDGRHAYTEEQLEQIKKELGPPRHPAHVSIEVAGGIGSVMRQFLAHAAFVLAVPIMAIPVLTIGWGLSWYWVAGISGASFLIALLGPIICWRRGDVRSENVSLTEKNQFHSRHVESA